MFSIYFSKVNSAIWELEILKSQNLNIKNRFVYYVCIYKTKYKQEEQRKKREKGGKNTVI